MVKLIALLRKKSELSREEFGRWWLDEHIKLSTQLPGVRKYNINLTLPGSPYDYFDGTAEMWWNNVAEMEAAFATEIGQQAGADADAHCSERYHIYTEERVIL